MKRRRQKHLLFPGVVLLGLGVWMLLSVTLAHGSSAAWIQALWQFYESLGHSPVFSLPGICRAVAGHALALTQLAAMLVAVYGAGGPLSRLLALRAGPAGRLAVQLVCGFSIIALLQHGLGLTGLFFRVLLTAEAGFFLVHGALFLIIARPWRTWRPSASGQWFPLVFTVLLLLVLMLLAHLPDLHEDTRVYHFAAPEHYLLLHKINAEPQHFSWHISQGCEMVFLIPWALGGVVVAKLVNVCFVLTTFLLMYSMTTALRPGSRVGWWACFWYVSAGLVIHECWETKNDIAVAMFVMAAALCAVEVMARRGTRWWLGMMWFLGAAVGVKYTAVIFVIALAVPLSIYKHSWLTWGKVVLGAAFVLTPVGGWPLESFLLLGNPFHPFLSGVFPEISWGPFYERGLHEFMLAFSGSKEHMTRGWLTSVWGVLGNPNIGSPGLIALLPFAFLWAGGQRSSFLKIGLVFAYILWLPSERFYHYLFPILPLVAVLVSTIDLRAGTSVAVWLPRGRLALAGVVMVMALLKAGTYMVPWGWLHLLGQMPAEDFLHRQYTTWHEVRRWINANLPTDARVFFTGEERRLWFTPRVISYAGVTEPLFWRLTRDSFSIREVRKRVHQRGITHHLHNFPSSEFRRLLWWPGPEWSDRQLALYQEFIRRYERPVYEPRWVDAANGGFYVFAITRRPNPDGFPVMYLPFTEGRMHRPLGLARAGRLREARAEAERRLAPYRDSLQAQFFLGVLAMKAGNHAEVLELLGPGIRAGYVASGNWNYYGAALGAVGRHNEAIEVFCRASLIYRESYPLKILGGAYHQRGQQHLAQGRPGRAFRDFECASWLRPGEPAPLYSSALALEQSGQFKKALGYARRALALSPDDVRIRKFAGKLERNL